MPGPTIAAAIAEQARTLEQVIFAGCTHEPAALLADRARRARAGAASRASSFPTTARPPSKWRSRSRSSTGSNRGEPRRLVVALEHAYHGDTFGAMSVSARGLFTEPFAEQLFEVERLPDPVEGDVVAALERCIDARGPESPPSSSSRWC